MRVWIRRAKQFNKNIKTIYESREKVIKLFNNPSKTTSMNK